MDPNEIGATLLVVLLVIFAIIGVLAVVALIVVIVRFRPPLTAIAAVVGALIYGASPIDLIPEAVVGPIGALDDIGIIAAAIGFMVTQIRKRRDVTAGRGDAAGLTDMSLRKLPPGERTPGRD